MTIAELRKKSVDELHEIVADTKSEIRRIRAERRTATDEQDANKPRELRKTIARALTIINEKQAEENA